MHWLSYTYKGAKIGPKSSTNAFRIYIDRACRWISSFWGTACMHFHQTLPHITQILPQKWKTTFETRKNTSNVFQNISNIILPFRERWFSYTYKGDFSPVPGAPTRPPGICSARLARAGRRQWFSFNKQFAFPAERASRRPLPRPVFHRLTFARACARQIHGKMIAQIKKRIEFGGFI